MNVLPVIDLGPYPAGTPGALQTVADEVRAALETVGFLLIVDHGIDRDSIARTFAEARRFPAQPADAKLALGMNEHNNGYMAMGRYVVWTAAVNVNDKPDLNDAFFTRRERSPDDPDLARASAQEP
jgi:isopenicillin N synthase-like dioxygenase